MNRKLGHFIRATLFALPLALPAVGLAQSTPSPTTSETNNGTQDNANRDVNPPDVQNSGSPKTNDRDVGGDVNMNSDQTTTTTTTKRTHKRSKRVTPSNDTSDNNINTR